MQLDIFREEVDYFEERLLGLESELVMELNNFKTRAAEFKTSINFGSACGSYMKEEPAQTKFDWENEVWDATRLNGAELSVRVDAPQQNVVVLKEARSDSQAKVFLLKKTHTCDCKWDSMLARTNSEWAP